MYTAFMPIYMSMYELIHVCLRADSPAGEVCMSLFMYVCIYVCMSVCKCKKVCTCIYLCMYVCRLGILYRVQGL